MSLPTAIDNSLLQQWIISNYSSNDVKKELELKGERKETIEMYLSAYSHLKLTRRQNKGFILLGIGSFLGFISFLLTASNLIPALHDFFLYGITVISILFILVGLYYLLEN